jgi:hypothetical protein
MILKSLYWSRGFTLSLFVLITLACGIRQDEFVCEDAHSHLQQCCAGTTLPVITCRYEAGGCAEGPTYPDLSIAMSACIRSESCDTLRDTGMCEKVAQLIAQPGGASGGYFTCPNGLTVGEPSDGGSWSLEAPDGGETRTPADAASIEPLDAESADAAGDAQGVDAEGDAESAGDANGVDATSDADTADARSDGEALDATPDRAVP